ncbi:MAG: response regulator [Chitinophagaceae bacterium]|nr:response regulator [Oligoflexus sp.]
MLPIYGLEHLLKSWLVKYAIVHNGVEVMKAFEKDNFDLLLFDLRLPIMYGFVTARKILKDKRESVRNIPMVAFSASSQNELVQQDNFVDFIDSIGRAFSL